MLQKIVEALIILTKNLIVMLLFIYNFGIRLKKRHSNYNTYRDIHSDYDSFNVKINIKQQYS